VCKKIYFLIIFLFFYKIVFFNYKNKKVFLITKIKNNNLGDMKRVVFFRGQNHNFEKLTLPKV